MSTLSSQPRITPQALLDRADGDAFELVNGQLVERKMGGESSVIGATIGMLLRRHVGANRLGLIFGADAGYRCFPGDPEKIRRADVSFISRGRLPNDHPPKGYIEIAPDLAVEVLSPRDLAYEVDANLAEYEEAGVRLVWVVHPAAQRVEIHRRGESSVNVKRVADTIEGEDVVPGFTCPVADFFKTED